MANRIVLYDGICNLCNKFVNFAKRNSLGGQLTFIPYQRAENYISKFPEIPRDMSTVAFIENDNVHMKTTAIFKICSHLKYPAYFLSWFKIIPKFIRDPVYNFVGKRRYKWFGTCECKFK